MQIKMIARGVENTFIINTAADFAAVEVVVKEIVESHNWGYSWLNLWLRLDVGALSWTASIHDSAGVFDSIELLAAGRDGQKMKCSEWHRGAAGTVDFSGNAERMLKNFLSECLFQTVMEWNTGRFDNIALRSAIADYLRGTVHGRELIKGFLHAND
jgi:hypothetical protein